MESLHEAAKRVLSGPEYVLYHDTLTSAVQEMERWVTKRGFTLDIEEMATMIGLGPRRPTRGKTNSYNLTLFKNGKEQRKKIHFQVTNLDREPRPFELNMYIS